MVFLKCKLINIGIQKPLLYKALGLQSVLKFTIPITLLTD